ncbi:MAG TPA: response regulator transcription factor [Erysipelothrix sp.]|nr:response regulator transcription factor [Erysipelothrix sp.]
MRVLIAEDEMDLNDIIAKKLVSEGYVVDQSFDGEEAIEFLSFTDYDVIVLDIMMPRVDGYEVLEYLRQQGKSTPVLFLTARDSVADRVKGLDLGANDYLVKPFSFEEFSARIRALTRTTFGVVSNVLEVEDLTLDVATQMVQRAGEEIELTAKEFTLLQYLMVNKGTVLSRDRIENHIWNFDYEGGTNVVDVYISYLRKKIDDGFDQKLIQTVRGRGYVIREGK